MAISTPSLECCPVALECKVKSITPLGTHDLFLFEVLNVKIDYQISVSNNKICFNKANLICYSHGEYYGLQSNPLGSFGYSVSKENKKNKKNKKSNFSKSNKKHKPKHSK